MKRYRLFSALLSITMCASLIMTPVGVMADEEAAPSESVSVEATEKQEPEVTEKKKPAETEKQESEEPEKKKPEETKAPEATEKQKPEETKKQEPEATEKKPAETEKQDPEESKEQETTKEPEATETKDSEETKAPETTEKQKPEETKEPEVAKDTEAAEKQELDDTENPVSRESAKKKPKAAQSMTASEVQGKIRDLALNKGLIGRKASNRQWNNCYLFVKYLASEFYGYSSIGSQGIITGTSKCILTNNSTNFTKVGDTLSNQLSDSSKKVTANNLKQLFSKAQAGDIVQMDWASSSAPAEGEDIHVLMIYSVSDKGVVFYHYYTYNKDKDNDGVKEATIGGSCETSMYAPDNVSNLNGEVTWENLAKTNLKDPDDGITIYRPNCVKDSKAVPEPTVRPSGTWIKKSCGSSIKHNTQVKLSFGAKDATGYKLITYIECVQHDAAEIITSSSETVDVTKTITNNHCFSVLYIYEVIPYNSLGNGPSARVWFSVTPKDYNEDPVTLSDYGCGKNLNWTLDINGTLTISGSGNMYNYTSYDWGLGVCDDYLYSPWTFSDLVDPVSVSDKIKKVVFTGDVTSIGSYAFGGCKNLKSITIPKSVTSIGKNAFIACKGLEHVYYGANESSWNRISISSGNSLLQNANIHFSRGSAPTKYDNTLDVKGKTAKVKYSKLKKKTQKLSASRVMTFSDKGQGALTFSKVSGHKKISINSTTGKVTIKKKLKKKKYKVKVRVMAAGDENYKASGWTTVTFTIKVK